MSRENEVEERENNDSMDDQANKDRHKVETYLLSQYFDTLNCQQLPGYDGGYADRGVPSRKRKLNGKQG